MKRMRAFVEASLITPGRSCTSNVLTGTVGGLSKWVRSNVEALMITCTILGVPDYRYSIMGPKTLF